MRTDVPGTRATLRYAGTAPNKVRAVLGLIRGLPVDEARDVLQFCERGAADEVAKLLDSAIANAEHNDNQSADELYVAACWADEGPTRKTGRARARGRFFRVRNRTSHVTVVLERFDVDQLTERAKRDEASGRGASAERRRRAIESAFDPPAHDEMRVCSTVVGAAAHVFLRPPAELAIRHHERRIPAADFLQRRAHRRHALGELGHRNPSEPVFLPEQHVERRGDDGECAEPLVQVEQPCGSVGRLQHASDEQYAPQAGGRHGDPREIGRAHV